MVDWDLRKAIVVNAVAAWKVPPGTSPTDARGRDAMQKELEAVLQSPDRLAALGEAEELLRKHGVSSEILSQSIGQYRQMLTSGRLPGTGPDSTCARLSATSWRASTTGAPQPGETWPRPAGDSQAARRDTRPDDPTEGWDVRDLRPRGLRQAIQRNSGCNSGDVPNGRQLEPDCCLAEAAQQPARGCEGRIRPF